ncbi:hypothetical protein [Thermodesulfovibrio thiophilus]|uniref:hypothetical protein n=1 Tax=Thermodesulfovibrio thiophilus TaxID=340095 RepID=UPI0003F8A24C|nr:hypothetical protein [Thermodesulfovibrio thiophilus]
MQYRIKTNYPTIIEIGGNAYMLFPHKNVDLPEDAEIVQTYEGLGYIERINETPTRPKKKEVSDAS